MQSNTKWKSKRVLDHVPIKQGLKHEQPYPFQSKYYVLDHVPIKQGLKRHDEFFEWCRKTGFRSCSNKTRIETDTKPKNNTNTSSSFRSCSNKTRIETNFF